MQTPPGHNANLLCTRASDVPEGPIQEAPNAKKARFVSPVLLPDLVRPPGQIGPHTPRVEGGGVGERLEEVLLCRPDEAGEACLVLLEDDLQVGAQRAGRGEPSEEHQHSKGRLARVSFNLKVGGQVEVGDQLEEELIHREAEKAIPPGGTALQAIPHSSAHEWGVGATSDVDGN